MSKRKTERRARIQDRVRNLATAAVDRAEATRVVGGLAQQPQTTIQKPAPQQLTLYNTMVSG